MVRKKHFKITDIKEHWLIGTYTIKVECNKEGLQEFLTLKEDLDFKKIGEDKD